MTNTPEPDSDPYATPLELPETADIPPPWERDPMDGDTVADHWAIALANARANLMRGYLRRSVAWSTYASAVLLPLDPAILDPEASLYVAP